MTLANNPTFQDENGLYSDARLLEYMAAIQNNARAKQQWDTFLKGVREEFRAVDLCYFSGQWNGSFYGRMVRNYTVLKMIKIDIEYLHVPYSSIADEDVTVSESEIKTYITRACPGF